MPAATSQFPRAASPLVSTLLSGAVFLVGKTPEAGMQACLWSSALLVLLSWFSSLRLPPALRTAS